MYPHSHSSRRQSCAAEPSGSASTAAEPDSVSSLPPDDMRYSPVAASRSKASAPADADRLQPDSAAATPILGATAAVTR